MAEQTGLQFAEKQSYYHATYQNTRNGFYTVINRAVNNSLFVNRYNDKGESSGVSGDFLSGAFADAVERGILKLIRGVEPSGLVEHTSKGAIYDNRWTVCHCAACNSRECESIAAAKVLNGK